MLRKEDKDWINKAISLDLTTLQLVKKLKDKEYNDEQIEEFLTYFEEKKKELEETILSKEEEESEIKDEKEFKENVRKYLNKEEGLSWNERRIVKKFIKEVKKYSKIMKVANEGFRKEIEYIEKKNLPKKEMNKDLEYLKTEIIDRIVESKAILDINHEKIKGEINKDNLKILNLDELIELIEDNIDALDTIVNGKIPEENEQ